jgi:hypothetical protein
MSIAESLGLALGARQYADQQAYMCWAMQNATPSRPEPRFRSIKPTRRMTDLEVERFNRAGLLRSA